MIGFIKKNWLTFAGIAAGVLGGYIYHYFWGCKNGCPIKSNLNTMLFYGGLMGGLLFNIVQGELEKRRQQK